MFFVEPSKNVLEMLVNGVLSMTSTSGDPERTATGQAPDTRRTNGARTLLYGQVIELSSAATGGADKSVRAPLISILHQIE